MSPRVARQLRKALQLPRLPKSMDPVQRASYRQLKARYLSLPSTARAMFMSNLRLLQSTINTQTI